MEIGVISDTHIREKHKSLPGSIFKVFAGLDHIFHLGDICHEDVILELKALAPVTAVSGNMDPPALQRKYGKLKKAEFKGHRILLTHGHYGPGSALESIKRQNTTMDCVVFGHSHQPCNQTYRGTLLFNPGSPTDYKRSYVKLKQPSVGILTVQKTGIQGKIIYLQN